MRGSRCDPSRCQTFAAQDSEVSQRCCYADARPSVAPEASVESSAHTPGSIAFQPDSSDRVFGMEASHAADATTPPSPSDTTTTPSKSPEATSSLHAVHAVHHTDSTTPSDSPPTTPASVTNASTPPKQIPRQSRSPARPNPHSPRQAPFNSPPKIISSIHLSPPVATPPAPPATTTLREQTASGSPASSKAKSKLKSKSTRDHKRTPSSPRLPISPTSQSLLPPGSESSMHGNSMAFNPMHAIGRTSELVHAAFSSDMHVRVNDPASSPMQQSAHVHAHEPAAPDSMHAMHASSSGTQAPAQIHGMEKVAKLMREAEKDADKAWATSLGQLLDAMAASRMALLGSFILTGQDRRRCKGVRV